MLHNASSEPTKPDTPGTLETREPDDIALPSGPRARFGVVLLDAARLWWHRVGLTMGVSLTGAGLLAVPFWIGRLTAFVLPLPMHYGLMIALLTIVGAVGLAGGFSVGWRACHRVPAEYADFWQGAQNLFRPALALAAINALVGAMLGVSLWYYGHIPAVWGRVASVICGYLLLFWLMMMVYHFPLLVAQESGALDDPGRQAKRGALPVLRRAFYLALGSPFFTFGLVAACRPDRVDGADSGSACSALARNHCAPDHDGDPRSAHPVRRSIVALFVKTRKRLFLR